MVHYINKTTVSNAMTYDRLVLSVQIIVLKHYFVHIWIYTFDTIKMTIMFNVFLYYIMTKHVTSKIHHRCVLKIYY
jgi:hypothetical protein